MRARTNLIPTWNQVSTAYQRTLEQATPPPQPVCNVPLDARRGRCWIVTLAVLLDPANDVGWELVHGVAPGFVGEPHRVLHAWLERDGFVYDPVSDTLIERDVMYASGRTPLARFDREGAVRTWLEWRTPGPWLGPLRHPCAAPGRRSEAYTSLAEAMRDAAALA